MKRSLNVAWCVAVVAVLGMLAIGANAQVAAKDARFTLPFEANWEGKILPPGDYTLTVAMVHGSLGTAYRIDVAGVETKATILAMYRPGPVATGSKLVAEAKGSIFNIRELDLAKADLVLTFPGAKPKQAKIAESNEPGVPIQIALK